MAAAAKRVHVFYHYPCPDGVFGALAVHAYYTREASKAEVCFYPCRIFEAPETVVPDPGSVFDTSDAAVFVDYTANEAFVAAVASAVGSVTILDHHKTAAEWLAAASLPDNVQVVMDMDRSGATIARDHYGLLVDPSLAQDGPGRTQALFAHTPAHHPDLHAMYAMVEDTDLWNWALPDSRPWSAGLSALDLEFSPLAFPGIFDALIALDPAAVIQTGVAALEEKTRAVNRAVEEDAFQVNLPDSPFPNPVLGLITSTPEYRSDLGNALALAGVDKGLPAIGLVAYKEDRLDDALIKVSLRSIGEFDISSIAKANGGGGHANAASFVCPQSDLESWKL